MNPVKIDNPVLQPYRCLFCTSGHKGGPVIDMLVDVLEGRAYICLAHAKRIAIAAGFAEGEELEKLSNAALLLAEAEKGIADRDSRITIMEDTTRVHHAQLEQLEAERDQARQQLAFAEDKLAELGQGIGATLAAVGHSTGTGHDAHYEDGRDDERREAMHGPLADEIKAEERVPTIDAPQSGRYVAEPILDDEGRFNERHEPK